MFSDTKVIIGTLDSIFRCCVLREEQTVLCRQLLTLYALNLSQGVLCFVCYNKSKGVPLFGLALKVHSPTNQFIPNIPGVPINSTLGLGATVLATWP